MILFFFFFLPPSRLLSLLSPRPTPSFHPSLVLDSPSSFPQFYIFPPGFFFLILIKSGVTAGQAKRFTSGRDKGDWQAREPMSREGRGGESGVLCGLFAARERTPPPSFPPPFSHPVPHRPLSLFLLQRAKKRRELFYPPLLHILGCVLPFSTHTMVAVS